MKKALLALAHLTPLGHYLLPRYSYNFTPKQLSFLVECLDETKSVPGDIIEIGCARGMTTCFLNQHLRTAGINKTYYCLDTFSGFLRDDVDVELSRGKHSHEFNGFRVNSLRVFRHAMQINGFDNVRAIQTDVKSYSFANPVSFCLLDVDLYQPSLMALRKLWPLLSPDGIIVVDDCAANNIFDGALQAYNEFAESNKLTAGIVLGKLGILRK